MLLGVVTGFIAISEGTAPQSAIRRPHH